MTLYVRLNYFRRDNISWPTYMNPGIACWQGMPWLGGRSSMPDSPLPTGISHQYPTPKIGLVRPLVRPCWHFYPSWPTLSVCGEKWTRRVQWMDWNGEQTTWASKPIWFLSKPYICFPKTDFCLNLLSYSKFDNTSHWNRWPWETLKCFKATETKFKSSNVWF